MAARSTRRPEGACGPASRARRVGRCRRVMTDRNDIMCCVKSQPRPRVATKAGRCHPGVMETGPGALLRQFGKTALLVSALAALIYIGPASIAAWPGARWLLALVLATPLTALLLWELRQSFREGELAVRGGPPVRRHRQPLFFWALIGIQIACTIGLAALSAWSTMELTALLR